MPTVRQLLTHNRNFRFLWYGQIVSQLGDWFNSVAMYTLSAIHRLGKSRGRADGDADPADCDPSAPRPALWRIDMTAAES